MASRPRWLLTSIALLTACSARNEAPEAERADRATDDVPTATSPSGASAASPAPASAPASGAASSPTTDPATPTRKTATFDTAAARLVEPRDWLERLAYDRGADLRFIDSLVDRRTAVPVTDRRPLPPHPPGMEITRGVRPIDDADPFPPAPPLAEKEVTIRVSVNRSTFRSRTREEVLSAVQPFIDLEQREVNVRGEAVLHEKPEETYYGLVDGKEQMAIAHIFEYLLAVEWSANQPEAGLIPLAYALPANPRVTELDRDLPGIPGTSIELIVARDSAIKSLADLKGKRLVLTVNYVCAPGAFLTNVLHELNHPPDQPFFGNVTLRRYGKDCVLDVIKGKADVACVDQGTVGALARFYGLEGNVRTLAVSPRYNMDVLFTSANNVRTHRTEIELTQRQLTTLGKDPEGQEVLFFFDVAAWRHYEDGDFDVARRHFAHYLRFIDHTPVDLRPLLDPSAPVDARTYDRFGDE